MFGKYLQWLVIVCVAGAGLVVAWLTLQTQSSGNIAVQDSWIRETRGGTRSGAGYLTIINHTKTPQRMVGVRAKFARSVQLHQTMIRDGLARMQEVSGGLLIAPGSVLDLEPGGHHLMFMMLDEPLRLGEVKIIQLEFADGNLVDVEMKVMPVGYQPK